MTVAIEKKAQARRDRALARRHKKDPLLNGSAVDVDTGERFEVRVMDGDGRKAKNRAPAVSANLKLLRPPPAGRIAKRIVQKRERYGRMKLHMEIAANVLACGGTRKQAAEKAGVNKRQISKYMTSADFRERIAEIQELLGGKIRGRVMKEINRRTGPGYIEKMELLDVLRVGDRFGLGRGAGSVIVNDNREIHNYEATFAAVIGEKQLSDSDEEGADFPEVELDSLSLPGGDTPFDS